MNKKTKLYKLLTQVEQLKGIITELPLYQKREVFKMCVKIITEVEEDGKHYY